MQETHNPYLACKRDTRYLLQWIVCAYNEVLRSPTAKERQQTQAKPTLGGDDWLEFLAATDDNQEAEVSLQKIQTPNDVTPEELSRGARKVRKKNKEAKAAEQDRSRPLEVYKLIEFNEGEPPEDWIELRDTLGTNWYAVARVDFNIAAVGASCQLATALIRQSELAILVDFADFDDFQKVLTTITRANQVNPSIFMEPPLAYRTADQILIGTKKEMVDTR
ncbi:hypothetical protein PspLS_09896 [Pyricularia sp. CBS 133598]|nr:hypothetical protein PspLS_09896 [Pyricularia sp. CBS 133598]